MKKIINETKRKFPITLTLSWSCFFCNALWNGCMDGVDGQCCGPCYTHHMLGANKSFLKLIAKWLKRGEMGQNQYCNYHYKNIYIWTDVRNERASEHGRPDVFIDSLDTPCDGIYASYHWDTTSCVHWYHIVSLNFKASTGCIPAVKAYLFADVFCSQVSQFPDGSVDAIRWRRTTLLMESLKSFYFSLFTIFTQLVISKCTSVLVYIELAKTQTIMANVS